MNAPLSPSDVPRGFSFAATHSGIKRARPDLAILVSEKPAAAAAMFTTNRVQAAPVHVSRANMGKSQGRMRGIIVNSGNANCCTGPAGYTAARETVKAFARELGAEPSQVLVCSTGVIGAPLRVEKILRALPELSRARRTDGDAFAEVARAIMTTDTRPKWATSKCRIGRKQIRILGCAKGSGMIEPNMATMLAFIVTDAAIPPSLLSRALRHAVDGTFHAITVDGDTSTNDSVMVLANGEAGAPRIAKTDDGSYKKFAAALETVCRSLALAIVEDGEGAQRVIEIEVRGAPSDAAADRVARTIANSPLVKTAFAGADPNWGRVLAAAGRAGVPFDFECVDIWLAGTLVCQRGVERPFSERAVREKMLAKHVAVAVDLRLGRARARMWTCDLTGEYVHINASYRT